MSHIKPIGTVVGSVANAFNQGLKTPPPSPVTSTTHEEKRHLNYYADFSGCGHWRMIWPEILLNGYKKCVIHGSTIMITDKTVYQNLTTVRLQRQASKHQHQFAEFIKRSKSIDPVRMIYEIDDILFHEDIPDYNKFRVAFESQSVREAAKGIIEMCDEVTVTCDYMKQYFQSKTTNMNVTVIPNFPPRFWMGDLFDEKQTQINYDKNIKKRKKPRVLWSGSGAHFSQTSKITTDDFTHINDTIIKTINKYQWVLFGSVPMSLKPYVVSGQIEFHPWVQIYDYPRKLKSLQPTVMIAPLVDNVFNNAKSELKLLEASAVGVPVVCQNIETYKNAWHKFATGDELVMQIDEIVKDKTSYMKHCRKYNNYIQSKWLEDNIDVYSELYNLPRDHPRRVNIKKYNP